MIRRHFEKCEELKAFATMKERIYTMLDESGFSHNQAIERILRAIDAPIDAEDIIAEYIDERIDLLKRVDGEKAVHNLEARISDIYNDLNHW